MPRSRRRALVSVHYAAIAALALFTIGDALTFSVFASVVAVPALALYAVDHLVLGGLAMRPGSAMDEREHLQVARAHHVAHRIALALLAILAASAIVAGIVSGSGVAAPILGILGIALLAVSVSLPAGVLLWSAPEPVAP